tara:strand:- start:4577 stop:5146 length:570 start_codon:yes stop_codon:yes gene_type:complete
MIVNIKEVKSNNNNPRFIKDDKFKKLVKSIKEFPEMLKLRPIVVNSEMIVLGGNMRLKACKEAGLKEVHILKADELTEQQQKEFIIKDNVGFGEWDWDILGNEWNALDIEEWGMDGFPFEQEDLAEDNEDFSLETSSGTSGLDYLKFGTYKVPMSINEIEELSKQVEKYIQENSVLNGFANKIIECLKK